jgi:uncharacterized surface protein with fasciclin (FAS1) repeats
MMEMLNKTVRLMTVAVTLVGFAVSMNTYASSCSAGATTAAKSTSAKSVVALASSSDDFQTLVAAIKAAGLVDVLQAEGPYTVFAPTDEAFAKLPQGTLENLLKPENKEQLIAILKYHVVPGKVMAADVRTMQAQTVQGQKVQLKVSEEGVYVDNAKVVKTDLMADNGVVHVIDTVILPKS